MILTNNALADFKLWAYKNENLKQKTIDSLKPFLLNEFIFKFLNKEHNHYISNVFVTMLDAYDYENAKIQTIELFNEQYNKL